MWDLRNYELITSFFDRCRTPEDAAMVSVQLKVVLMPAYSTYLSSVYLSIRILKYIYIYPEALDYVLQAPSLHPAWEALAIDRNLKISGARASRSSKSH